MSVDKFKALANAFVKENPEVFNSDSVELTISSGLEGQEEGCYLVVTNTGNVLIQMLDPSLDNALDRTYRMIKANVKGTRTRTPMEDTTGDTNQVEPSESQSE